jgi:hypothetical protein
MPTKSDKASLESELESLIRLLAASNAGKEIEDPIDIQESIKSSRFLNLKI